MNQYLPMHRRWMMITMLFIHGLSYSQTDATFCKTAVKVNPYFSADRIESSVHSNTPAIIPIALHLVTDSMGEGNEMTPELFLQWLDTINLQLITADLQVELCVLNIVRDEQNLNPLIDFDFLLMDSLLEGGYVNIFMPNTVGGNSSAGYSSIIGGIFTDDDYLFILGKGATYGLIAHELGHFFGLYHTFESQFGEELVDGSNCSVAGDLLCDTEADHGLQHRDVDSLTCSWLYPNSVFDSNNEPFRPSTTNFMSYSQLHCIKDFTPQQLQVMRNTYELNADYFESCNITSAHHGAGQTTYTVEVYPNPVKDKLYIDLSKVHGQLQFVLYDHLGRPVIKKEGHDHGERIALDTYHLPSGAYILHISGQHFSQTKRVNILTD
ncbi:MAG: zinc-dependent metalloprotease [Bacteroidota bacterium]